MNDNDKFWKRFGGMIRKARNDCPFTAEQAQRELDALLPADERPLAEEEISKAVDKVLKGDFESEQVTTDPAWVDSYGNSSIESDTFAFNRNKGTEDPDTGAKLDRQRQQVDDEEDDDEQDEPGLATPTEPPKQGS